MQHEQPPRGGHSGRMGSKEAKLVATPMIELLSKSCNLSGTSMTERRVLSRDTQLAAGSAKISGIRESVDAG